MSSFLILERRKLPHKYVPLAPPRCTALLLHCSKLSNLILQTLLSNLPWHLPAGSFHFISGVNGMKVVNQSNGWLVSSNPCHFRKSVLPPPVSLAQLASHPSSSFIGTSFLPFCILWPCKIAIPHLLICPGKCRANVSSCMLASFDHPIQCGGSG